MRSARPRPRPLAAARTQPRRACGTAPTCLRLARHLRVHSHALNAALACSGPRGRACGARAASALVRRACHCARGRDGHTAGPAHAAEHSRRRQRPHPGLRRRSCKRPPGVLRRILQSAAPLDLAAGQSARDVRCRGAARAPRGVGPRPDSNSRSGGRRYPTLSTGLRSWRPGQRFCASWSTWFRAMRAVSSWRRTTRSSSRRTQCHSCKTCTRVCRTRRAGASGRWLASCTRATS